MCPVKKLLTCSTVIHTFALLHAGTTIFLLSRESSDEAILTLLTITMVVLLCYIRKLSMSFTIVAVILSNVVGYFLGLAGAGFLGSLNITGPISNTLATFFTTEVIGWLLYLLANTSDGLTEGRSTYRANPLWLLVIVLLIFSVRMLLMTQTNGGLYTMVNITVIFREMLRNSLAVLLLVGGDMLIASFLTARPQRMSRLAYSGIILSSAIALAIIAAILSAYNFPFRREVRPDGATVARFCVISVVLQSILLTIIYLVSYAVKSRRLVAEEKSKALIAQYRYIKLKQQLNPHFLFNSLNILDYLVVENRNTQASTFIQKLASIYRYLLQSEDRPLVTLREEMDFVHKYVDMLQLRFGDGLDVEFSVPDGIMDRLIVPCSLQLPIENATKHNIVSTDNPLKVSLRAEGDSIVITNPLHPKASIKTDSTGHGLEYIQKQYQDLARKPVKIENGVVEDGVKIFRVTIPTVDAPINNSKE